MSDLTQREIDERLTRAYSGQGDAMLEGVVKLLSGQAWPNDRRRGAC